MPQLIEITTLSMPQLAPYASLTEGQLRSRKHREEGLFIAESEKVIAGALRAGYEPLSLLAEKRQLRESLLSLLSAYSQLPVYTADRDLLSQLTGYALTRGVLCCMRRKPLPRAEELIRVARRVAVLQDITDASNVGAIMRSAAALNVDALLLSPSCCDPLCRKAIRVSMGTVFTLPWTYLDAWPKLGIDLLHQHGFTCVALALDDRAIDIRDEKLKQAEKLAILLGTEGTGLKPETLALCDHTVIIPMRAGVDSLNVGAAAAIAMWELRCDSAKVAST